MLKPLIQIFTALYFSLVLTLSTACQPSELTKKALIQQTFDFLDKQEPKAAIELLEKNIEAYEQDADILKLLAQAHLQANDPFTATIILLNAYEINPKNAGILDLYFNSLKAANMNTEAILLDVAKITPTSLKREEWQQVSQLFANQGNYEDALNAYFNYLGSKKASSDTSPSDALKVGDYYLAQEKTKEATSWLSLAANSDSIQALPAQLKLLSIEYQNKDWLALSRRIERIEAQFPNALSASSFSELPQLVSQKLEEKQQTTLNKSRNYNSGPIDSSKSGSIQNIEDLEAYANQIAKPFLEETESVDSSITEFNPEIEIEPADPYFSDFETSEFGETFDPSSIATIKQNKLSDAEISALVTQANESVLKNDLDTAAELYRKVLDNSPTRHEIWDRIAQVYFANEEYNAAESAALQAIRYQPGNIAYTINYLNIAKKTKSEIRFLSELLSASKQFPNSPEITLSLARAYERNIRYRFKAKEYYIKFITLAPNHPQRSEAEAAIARLP